MINLINKYINKQFVLGMILCFGIFSKYILGPNNFIEEISEFCFFVKTGKDINFSEEPETLDSHLKEVQDFIMTNGR
jgi:hypothetical protein